MKTTRCARKVEDWDSILSVDNYAGKMTKREFLNSAKRKEFLDSFDRYFETRVDVPRIKRGKGQELETLINEEALLLASYLRNERQTWIPRIANLFL